MGSVWRFLLLVLHPIGRLPSAFGFVDFLQAAAALLGLAFTGWFARAIAPLTGLPDDIWLAIPALLAAALLGVAGLKVQSRLDQHETPSLDLTFDPQTPSAFHQRVVRPDGQVAYEFYRVGVVNLSGQSIQNVMVLLASFTPQGAEFLPAHLRFMHDANGQPSIAGVTVHPGEVNAFVDVVRASYFAGDPALRLAIVYANDQTPCFIPPEQYLPEKYRFTLRAVGANTPARERDFLIWWEDGRLQFANA